MEITSKNNLICILILISFATVLTIRQNTIISPKPVKDEPKPDSDYEFDSDFSADSELATDSDLPDESVDESHPIINCERYKKSGLMYEKCCSVNTEGLLICENHKVEDTKGLRLNRYQNNHGRNNNGGNNHGSDNNRRNNNGRNDHGRNNNGHNQQRGDDNQNRDSNNGHHRGDYRVSNSKVHCTQEEIEGKAYAKCCVIGKDGKEQCRNKRFTIEFGMVNIFFKRKL